jgi:regulator of replication initiation timing
MGIFSMFRVLMILIPLIGAGGGLYYIKNLQSTLDEYRVANLALNEAVSAKESEIARINENVVELREITDSVIEEKRALAAEVDNLRTKFSKHDLGYLAEAKPGLVEKIINRAIKNDVEDVLKEIMDD